MQDAKFEPQIYCLIKKVLIESW